MYYSAFCLKLSSILFLYSPPSLPEFMHNTKLYRASQQRIQFNNGLNT